jgi:hypothetical protein
LQFFSSNDIKSQRPNIFQHWKSKKLLAQPFDEVGGDPITQASLDEAAGEEEEDDIYIYMRFIKQISRTKFLYGRKDIIPQKNLGYFLVSLELLFKRPFF